MTVRVALPYGTGDLGVDIDESRLLAVVEPEPLTEAVDETSLIRNALEHPVGSDPLPDLAKPSSNVAIIVSDVTRPCPTRRLLPPLLGELGLAGIGDEDIVIVFGLGAHRKQSVAEQMSLVGPEIFERIRCVDSDADNCIRLGTTSRGTPVEVFAPVIEADFVVGVGNIDLHRFAGYAGGAKALMPGVCSVESITRNHALLLQPGAVAGRMIGNPVREDIEEAAQIAGIGFILNVVLDRKNQIREVVAGDTRLAHKQGCGSVDALNCITIAREAEIILVSPGGYPRDISLFQAQKALDSAKEAVKEGGIIILVAECREGIGGPNFETWLREADDADEVLERIRREFVLGGNKVFSIALTSKKAQIYLVSDLPPVLLDECWRMPGLHHFSNLEKALGLALSEMGSNAEIIVMPKGNSTLPMVEKG